MNTFKYVCVAAVVFIVVLVAWDRYNERQAEIKASSDFTKIFGSAVGSIAKADAQ